MTRESIDAKARRLLTAGALTVDARNGDIITGRCQGDHGLYHLGFDGRDWYCDCPARRACAHLAALALCTVDKARLEAVA